MAPKTHGLRATLLATLVAFAGVAAFTAPVAATDPAPIATPTPSDSATPTDAPAPTAAPSDAPSASPSPSDPAAPSLSPMPSDSPAPSVSPAPMAPAAPTVTPTPFATPTPVAAAPVVAAAPRANIGARIVRIAKAQRGKRYVFGAAGPWAFDCSGFVRYVYRRAGVSWRLGGGHSSFAMYVWARRHHLASRSQPRIGDVVIYGNGSHVGIYIGHGLVISALNPRLGIRITALHGLTTPFTTFIHTHV